MKKRSKSLTWGKKQQLKRKRRIHLRNAIGAQEKAFVMKTKVQTSAFVLLRNR